MRINELNVGKHSFNADAQSLENNAKHKGRKNLDTFSSGVV